MLPQAHSGGQAHPQDAEGGEEAPLRSDPPVAAPRARGAHQRRPGRRAGSRRWGPPPSLNIASSTEARGGCEVISVFGESVGEWASG